MKRKIVLFGVAGLICAALIVYASPKKVFAAKSRCVSTNVCPTYPPGTPEGNATMWYDDQNPLFGETLCCGSAGYSRGLWAVVAPPTPGGN